MHSVLIAERTVFLQLDTFRIVLLILNSIVVSLLAFCTRHCNFYSHVHTSFWL